MRNRFCEAFQVDHPIVLAPMAGAVSPELVAAVSNAGGLGLAPLWHVTVEELVSYIAEIRSLTERPFGVNLNMAFPSIAHLEACLDEKVPAISLFWGDPTEFTARAKSGNCKVIVTVSDAASARHAAELGVDAICAQGWEAGGHVYGTVASMPLVPSVVDSAGDVPVIAAGGIADGRGLVAAFALGASAAWIGTRFLAAEEALTHPMYLQQLLRSNENDTVHFENLFDVGWPEAPHRVLKNSTAANWFDAGRPPPGERPGEGDVLAKSSSNHSIVRYQSITPSQALTGEIEALSLWSGQGVSMVRKSQPAAEIVSEIIEESRLVIEKINQSYKESDD